MNVWLIEIWRAWRASVRRPGFLLLASGVLALGIGASVAVFALIQSTLLRPLPVPHPSRLVVIGSWQDAHVRTISPHYYQQLATLKGVASVALKQAGSMANIAGDGAPEQVPRIYADRHLLPTLGLQPVLGHNFNAQEDSPGGPLAAMLSYGYWRRHFAGDLHIVGRRLRVEGVERTIVGVLPASFNAVAGAGDVIVPLALPAVSNDDGANYMVIARLAEDADAAAVTAEVDARLHALDAAAADGVATTGVRYGVESLASWLHRGARPVLQLFLASALLVLLIALVNIANLMLLRTLSRGHDVAVRSALGAPRLRLMVPALGEGLLVGVGGALLGVALATLGLTVMQSFIPTQWLAGGVVNVSAFAWVLALLVGLLVAALAAGLALWRSRGVASVEELREGGRSGAGHQAGWLGRVLVVAQVALAVVLLGAAGVFAHALYDASRMPLGFVGDQVLSFELAPVQASYPNASAVDTLTQRLTERLRTIPGVTAAAVTTNLPTSTDNIGSFGQFQSAMHVPGGNTFAAQYHGVGPGYFELLSIPLQRGRYFARSDTAGSERVAIVSRDLADTRYGGQPLGKIIDVGADNAVWPARIVGVVGDTWQHGPLQPRQPVLYVPLAQMPDPTLAIFRRFEPLRFVLSGHGNPDDWRAGVRAAVAQIAPDQPIANLRSLRSILHATTADARLNLLLIGVFSALAVLLAAAGLYAVMAVAVAAREREFGVRAALGAAPRRLLLLVLRGGLLQIALGLLAGVVLGAAGSGVLRAVVVQLGRSVFDPWSIVVACVVLACAGLLACVVPAVRAGRTAPMRALRGA